MVSDPNGWLQKYKKPVIACSYIYKTWSKTVCFSCHPNLNEVEGTSTLTMYAINVDSSVQLILGLVYL